MTTAQAADLQAKWKQQGDPPPLCEHPVQELAHLARSDTGYLDGYLSLPRMRGSNCLHPPAEWLSEAD